MGESSQKGIHHYTSHIIEKLAHLVSWVELANDSNRTDINISCEYILCNLLNKVYQYHLENANSQVCNFPAVDLVDEDECIAFQITSTNSVKKVRDTLTGFFDHHLDKNFDRLVILVITNQDATKGMLKVSHEDFFDGKRDIWNIPYLLRDIQNISEVDRLREISDFLDEAMGIDFNALANKVKDKKTKLPETENNRPVGKQTAAADTAASSKTHTPSVDEHTIKAASKKGKKSTAQTVIHVNLPLENTVSNDAVVIHSGELRKMIEDMRYYNKQKRAEENRGCLGTVLFVLAIIIYGFFAPLTEMPEKLAGYNVIMNGEEVCLPTTFQYMLERGWMPDDAQQLEQKIGPNTVEVGNIASSQSMELGNGYGKIRVYYCNPSNDTLQVRDCIIYRLIISQSSYDQSYTGESVNVLQTALELTLGTSKRNDFNKVKPRGSDTSKTPTTVSSTYQVDESHIYKFIFGSDNKVLLGVDITHADSEILRSMVGDEYKTEKPSFNSEALRSSLGVDISMSVDGRMIPVGCAVAEYSEMGYLVEPDAAFIASGNTAGVRINVYDNNWIEAMAFDPFNAAYATEHCYLGNLNSKNIYAGASDVALVLTFPEHVLTIQTGTNEEKLKTELTEFGIEWVDGSENNVLIYPNSANKNIVVMCGLSAEGRAVSEISVDICQALQDYFTNLGL